MAKTDNAVDFSLNRASGIGRLSAANVPRYILYGDASERPDWFVNVEPLDRRCREIGWIIEPHTHPRFTQIVFCEAGGGEMSIEGETLAFAPGSVMIVPPHRIHGFRYLESTVGWVLTIESNYLADLLIRAPALKTVLVDPGVFDPDRSVMASILPELEALSSELQHVRTASAIAAEIHLLSILLLLLRQWPEAGAGRQAKSGRSAIVDRFKEVVERRYREQPMLPEIADELRISVSQLRAACKIVAGISPIEIVHDRLLAEAKRCLSYTPMSISEISDWLGFSDPGYFSRFFTKGVGTSPSAYRRRQNLSEHEHASPEAGSFAPEVIA